MSDFRIRMMHICRDCLSKKTGVSIGRSDVVVRRKKDKCRLCGKEKHIVYKLRVYDSIC